MKNILVNHKSKIIRALVELLIIFVGISASFMVDEWRQSEAAEALEIEYLTALYDDIISDSEKIDLILKDKQERMIFTQDMLNAMLFPDSIPLSQEQFKMYFGRMTFAADFVSSQNTYKDLLYSGNIKLIEDRSLKNSIYNYYEAIEKQGLALQNYKDISTRVVESTLLNDFSIASVYNMTEFYQGADELQIMDMSFFKERSSAKFKAMENLIITRLICLMSEIGEFNNIRPLLDDLKKKLAAKLHIGK